MFSNIDSNVDKYYFSITFPVWLHCALTFPCNSFSLLSLALSYPLHGFFPCCNFWLFLKRKYDLPTCLQCPFHMLWGQKCSFPHPTHIELKNIAAVRHHMREAPALLTRSLFAQNRIFQAWESALQYSSKLPAVTISSTFYVRFGIYVGREIHLCPIYTCKHV